MILGRIDRIKKYIKLLVAYPNYQEVFHMLKKQEKNRAILIGTPIHGNLGDSLIARQCLLYLKGMYSKVVEIPEFLYELFSDKLVINEDDDIYVCGGGWMGNLYEDELVVEDILDNYLKNQVIILPQTVCFSHNGKYSSIENLKKKLIANDRAILCVRDRASYVFALNNLGLVESRCFLLPDMALLGLKDMLSNEKSEKKIIFSIRNDIEKCTSDADIDAIRLSLSSRGYRCVDSSTVINKKIVKIRQRDRFVNDKIREYSEADLIITDRLHSMVFALLAGKKCIAIDNSTHKVEGVYREWLPNMKGLIVLRSSSELTIDIVNELLASGELPEPIDLKNRFVELKR